MRRPTKVVLASIGIGVAAWIGWGLYTSRTTDRVPHTTERTVGGVEIRRYPRVVLAETEGETTMEAFRRLYEYITGANEGSEEIEMTAPVRSRGATIPMTAPVRTRRSAETVTMGFYLPPEYSPDSAPNPTDSDVTLTVEEPRRLAVRSFSWYATAGRIEAHERRLRQTLDANDVATAGEPFVLQYDDPRTPPFLRTNEVAVEVA